MSANPNPVFGIKQIPFTGLGFMQTQAMKNRAILAANFKKLRAAMPWLSKFPDITKAGGGTNGTLGRISTQESAATVDTLEQLAAIYGLEAWQMLVPTLDVRQGPNGEVRIGGLPDWPFPMIDRDRYERLTAEQRGYIQSKLEDLISAQETVPVKNGTR